jgi:hypothetical protein
MSDTSKSKWYWQPNFLGYSVGCALAWAVIWVLVGILANRHTVQVLAYVFLGWVIGWISASIARLVYPPPSRTLINRRAASN